MEENKQIDRKIIRISRKKIIISVIVLIIGLVLVSIVLSSFSSARMRSLSLGGNNMVSQSFEESSMFPDYYRYQDKSSSIRDTREFMKTSYNSSIETRDVSKTVTTIKNIVKGADGRVDSLTSSSRYGHISFVVAKSNFDDFRDEVESITHKKLYTESISSSNLLSEKQGIEGQILDASTSLSSLNSQRDALVSSHAKTINSMNKELIRINGDLANVRANIALLPPTEINVSYSQQEASLVEQQTNQTQNINQENKNYLIKKQNLDNLINNANANLGSANKQDGQFMDNIETVEGYISVSWISLWGMAVLFSPIHPTWVIIILVILSIVLFRKRMPKVEIIK